MKPSVGRIVHIVGANAEVCLAAVITHARNGQEDATISLAVLAPDGLVFDNAVAYSEDHEPSTWHWPERVE